MAMSRGCHISAAQHSGVWSFARYYPGSSFWCMVRRRATRSRPTEWERGALQVTLDRHFRQLCRRQLLRQTFVIMTSRRRVI